MEPTYDGNNIIVLEGLDAVRKRPAMYIGSTDYRGIHHLVYEVVDNSIDETMAGYCDLIKVTIHIDNSVSVSDNGRGIPIDKHPTQNISSLQVVLTKLHAGGKFDHNSYKISGGLHGVGISVVNALSEQLNVIVRRDGNLYKQQYEKGDPISDVKKGGKTNETGTTVSFRPDEDIFGTYVIDFNILSERLEELAYLNGGLTIQLIDERTNKVKEFKFDGGIQSLIKKVNSGKKVVHPLIYGSKSLESGVYVEFVFQYHVTSKSILLSFCNNIKTIEGGTHTTGIKTALTRSFNSFIQSSPNLPKKYKQYKVTGEDILLGLSAVINVGVPEPQFEGQTKTKLGNNEVAGEVQSFVSSVLSMYLNENFKNSKSIIERLIQSAKEREAARKAKDMLRKKSGLSGFLLSSKLADCRSRNVKKRELFIVEGDSAGGSAKQGRDSNIQAILPLRGKVLNIEKAEAHKILKNTELRSLIASLGIGFGEDIDIKKLRYAKIIIMTDADVDGAHIRTLLLTFFFRQFREIIENGHLYISEPPLYRIYKRGFEKFISNEMDLESFLIAESGVDIAISNLNGKIYKNKKLQSLMINVRDLNLHTSRVVNMGIPEVVFSAILGYIKNDLNSKKILNPVILKDFTKHMLEMGFSIELESKIVEGEDRHFIRVKFGRKFINIGIEFFRSNVYRSAIKIMKILLRNSNELKFQIPGTDKFFDHRNFFSSISDIVYSRYSVQRYKGLGEMNPEQLWKTTMNPDVRNLYRVQIPDVDAANRSFRMLMGSNVELRRNFIESNTLSTSFIDF